MGPLGFRYYRPDGRLLKGPGDLKRIRALAVPPAWKDVWICLDPRGHLQATGRASNQGGLISLPARDSRFELIDSGIGVALLDHRLESVRSRARFDRQRVVLHQVNEFGVLEVEGVSACLAVGNEGEPHASGDQVTDAMSDPVVVHHAN